jgi:PTS system nitrogen regulatory IIA component
MPMLRLADYLREDLVLWDLPPLDKPTFLKALSAEVAARVPGVDAEDLATRLIEREEQQSTGVGGGLALPHAMLEGLEKTVVAVCRAREGIDFAALDSEPVDVFFLLLSAQNAHTEHLRVLARLVRIIAPEETLEMLRRASGPEQLYRMLLEEDARHVY